MIKGLEELGIKPDANNPIDPEMISWAQIHDAYQNVVANAKNTDNIGLAVERPNGTFSRYDMQVLPQGYGKGFDELTTAVVRDAIKFVLWQRGGRGGQIGGPAWLTDQIDNDYQIDGRNDFDVTFMGNAYSNPNFGITPVRFTELPEGHENRFQAGGHWDGYRIGFDVGGSDVKGAAVINGEVVFSHEEKWDGKTVLDPQYHLNHISKIIRKVAEHLPQVDGIGGSTAGMVDENFILEASFIKSITGEDRNTARNLYNLISEQYPGVPFTVFNDGEVTALAGAHFLGVDSLIGTAFGTNTAKGFYVNGCLTDWINEGSFWGLDAGPNQGADPWSEYQGAACAYLSQKIYNLEGVQALGLNGIPNDMDDKEKLARGMELAEAGNPDALKVYEAAGRFFAHEAARNWQMYEHVLDHMVLGRLTDGDTAGQVLLDAAKATLDEFFPEYGVRIHMPESTQMKRHGQAYVAASLVDINEDAA